MRTPALVEKITIVFPIRFCWRRNILQIISIRSFFPKTDAKYIFLPHGWYNKSTNLQSQVSHILIKQKVTGKQYFPMAGAKCWSLQKSGWYEVSIFPHGWCKVLTYSDKQNIFLGWVSPPTEIYDRWMLLFIKEKQKVIGCQHAV